MQWANLDSIVRRSLLEKGLPIHWYAEILTHQAAAIRELAKDSLKIVNAANIPVNDYGAIDLPGDFKDDISVCVPVGGLLQPIPKKDSINPIRVHNTTTGLFEPYASEGNLDNQELTFFGINTSYFWYWNVNDYGEPTGRYFGANGGAYLNGYKVIKERRQIQLTGTFTSGDAILLYVSNGQNVDNASQVDWDAHAAIQAYSDWKMSPNADKHLSPEARSWWNARRLFRANTDDLTLTDVRQIIRSNFTATIKN